MSIDHLVPILVHTAWLAALHNALGLKQLLHLRSAAATAQVAWRDMRRIGRRPGLVRHLFGQAGRSGALCAAKYVLRTKYKL